MFRLSCTTPSGSVSSAPFSCEHADIGLFWQFTHYFAFCAVVVVYVYAIQHHGTSPDEYVTMLQAASRCQLQISMLARPGSLPERYGVVLRELRLEMLRHNPGLRVLLGETEMEHNLLAEAPRDRFDLMPHVPYGVTGNPHDAVHPYLEDPNAVAEPSPSSSIAQMTGWGRFDSLVRRLTASVILCVTKMVSQVSAGIGGSGWEVLLSDNPMEGWDLTSAGMS